ncbi:hypothetical protein B0H10DRAFT_909550 [Mycena sp. CBHHK59/15]|nr:hypothetical protein B0H10DRAFT_909550 [Mycena sp. CBHHK59/15]
MACATNSTNGTPSPEAVGLDKERAFIEFACAATLIMEMIPAHLDYGGGLNVEQRANLAANGQGLLLNLEKLKAALVEPYERYTRSGAVNAEAYRRLRLQRQAQLVRNAQQQQQPPARNAPKRSTPPRRKPRPTSSNDGAHNGRRRPRRTPPWGIRDPRLERSMGEGAASIGAARRQRLGHMRLARGLRTKDRNHPHTEVDRHMEQEGQGQRTALEDRNRSPPTSPPPPRPLCHPSCVPQGSPRP